MSEKNKTPFVTYWPPVMGKSKYTLWYVSNCFTLILLPKPG